MAIDTVGYLLAIYITAANEQDRDQVAELSEQVQGITGGRVELAFVDQGYMGQQVIADAASQGLKVEVIKLSDVKNRDCKISYVNGWNRANLKRGHHDQRTKTKRR